MINREELKNLPRKPGVYLMRDKDETVIYVGKAKVLKNRVSQYFQAGNSHSQKVTAMVNNVARFEYIVTDTELEALTLECNLIKEYMPKYNILMKDGKGMPYIKLTLNEEYPRALLAYRIKKDGSKYYGPYTSNYAVKETLEAIKKLFAIRNCEKELPKEIGKGRECLNYHIKLCSGPCNNKITAQEYRGLFADIASFLDGKHELVLKKLEASMLSASEMLDFELAAKIRDRLKILRRMTEKQKVVSANLDNKDFLAFAQNDTDGCMQMFFMREGKIIGRESHMLTNAQNSPPNEVMSDYIKQYYSMANYIPAEIVVGNPVEDAELLQNWLSEKTGHKIRITVPQRGDKSAIINLVKNNAIENLQLLALKKDKKNRKINDLLFELKELLSLKKAPMRIEAYDISNISGADSVGVCVVFENTIPKKSDYKKFNIRSVETPDDYESMREIIYRRISNGVEKEKGFVPLPDLILLDGGKGHVSAIMPVLDYFELDTPLFGMVKDDKHKTRGVTTATQEVDIKRTSAVFRLLTQIQDEVHRFAINAHRVKHKKTVLGSDLENIKGVGPAKRKKLLKHFGTMTKIKNASIEELVASGIDKATAEIIYSKYN